MKYKRSALVGRNELPEDREAFLRLNKVFANPTVPNENRYRRLRQKLSNGKTKAG